MKDSVKVVGYSFVHINHLPTKEQWGKKLDEVKK